MRQAAARMAGKPSNAAVAPSPTTPSRMRAFPSCNTLLGSNSANSAPATPTNRKLLQHPSMAVLTTKAVKLNYRQRLYRALERPRTSRQARLVFILLIICIFLSIGTFFFSSIGPEVRNSTAILTIEYVCTTVFTLELIVRFYIGTNTVFLIRNAKLI